MGRGRDGDGSLKFACRPEDDRWQKAEYLSLVFDVSTLLI